MVQQKPALFTNLPKLVQCDLENENTALLSILISGEFILENIPTL